MRKRQYTNTPTTNRQQLEGATTNPLDSRFVLLAESKQAWYDPHSTADKAVALLLWIFMEEFRVCYAFRLPEIIRAQTHRPPV